MQITLEHALGYESSPVLGTGTMSLGIAEVAHMNYVSAKMPYNITAAN